MSIPVEYHILFLLMSFIFFILTILFLFVNNTFEKTIAANILIAFNLILNFISGYSFNAIDLYGHNTNGTVVHNIYSELYPFTYIYWAFVWVNIMLIFYCIYLYLKKPIDEYTTQREEYYGEGYNY